MLLVALEVRNEVTLRVHREDDRVVEDVECLPEDRQAEALGEAELAADTELIPKSTSLMPGPV
ncbi:MAG: hypothetical protein JWP63_3885 [Candidatus Solibacter sp.]|nr:hypothetical protein [Candidatus Solibacter sp.]